jgi:NAD(P)H dehydrogenase (quinone)
MPSPTVLVLGATGKIGSALIEEFLPDHSVGHLRVIAGVRNPSAARAMRERGIETRLVDLDIAETQGLGQLVQSIAGIDRMFLLTGYDVKMLAQSKAAIDAAKAAGVTHLVHIGAYARSDTTIVHLGWHQLIEAYIARSGMAYTHLHPNTFMQNLPMLMSLSPAGPGTVANYIGDARPSWIDCNDIAAVAAAVLRDPAPHADRAYPLATEAASMDEVAALLANVTGLPWRSVPQEPEAFFAKVAGAGADPVYMACVSNVFARMRNGSLPEISDVFDTVERLTGRAPTSLRAFVEKQRATFTYTPRS